MRTIIYSLSGTKNEIIFLDKISKDLGLDIIFWEVDKKNYNYAKNFFPKIQESKKSKRELIDYYQNNFDFPIIDEKIIKKLSKYELSLYPSYLRNSQINAIRADMFLRDEYYQFITFRYYFLRHLKPDFILFANVPTGFFNLIDYYLCEEFNIKKIVFKRIDLPNNFVYPEKSLEVDNFYEKNEFTKINKNNEVVDYILSIKKDYKEAMPEKWMDNKDDPYNTGFAYKYEIANNKLKKKGFLLKDILITSFKMKKNFSDFFYILLKSLIYYYFRLKLIKSYKKYSTKNISFKENYVYFPLSFQPEAGSIPLGGDFASHEIVISMLSRSIPKNWKIYVKEHPTHLLSSIYINSLKFRHPVFYKNIKRYKNVEIVPENITSFQLIDNAKCVAGHAGHPGIETIVREKQYLLFSLAWYSKIEGINLIKTYEDLESFFKNNIFLKKPNLEKIIEQTNLMLNNSYKNFYYNDTDDKESFLIYANSFVKRFKKYLKR